MNKTKKLKKFLRKHKALRWFKHFLRCDCFPPELAGDVDLFKILAGCINPFTLNGFGYNANIIAVLRGLWDKDD